MLNLKKKLVKLFFTSEVHFGRERLSDSELTIKADTLFSALFIEAIRLKIDTEFLLKDIRISDTFPFKHDIFYLPKPLKQVLPNEDEPNFKQFKRLSYLPSNMLKDYFTGNLSSSQAEELNDTFNLGMSNTHTKNAKNIGQATEENPTEVYTLGSFAFDQDAGLYFFIQASEESLEQLTLVLSSLQYSGLGGKRSSGYGQFTYTVTEDHFILDLFNQSGKHKMLLSTAMVDSDEASKISEQDYFSIQRRSGFIQSPNYASRLVKRKDLYTFQAGSVFKNIFEGKIFNVGKNGNHPVYRYAKAMWLEV